MEDLNSIVRQHHAEVVALRRHFRTYPEVAGEEVKTQQKIIAELQALGLEPRPAAGTGVIAEIRGALPGRTVAIRADIDALPVPDECDQPYRSQHPGISHACGHDGHTAMLLGAARILTGLRGRLPGTVRLLFQPSEEKNPGGALGLIAAGALDGVDVIIGAHLWQPIQVGKIGITYGRMMAAPDEFSITVKGRGGHGSMPQQTVDALLVGSQVVVALNTIISRSVDPLEQAVLSVCAFNSGEVFNIIPDTALLRGTVRTFEQQLADHIFQRIEQTAKGVCSAAGAECVVEKIAGYPPLVNTPAVAKVLAAAGRKVLGDAGVIEIQPAMGGEDFSHYLRHVPGAFVFIGAGNDAKGLIYPHHHPKFDFDEDAMASGVEIMVRTAIELLA
ncbi:MAG: amidohydrolase [Negativicutes bacterium]|nr:amidohydrolase [Negativicutes bacterium]